MTLKQLRVLVCLSIRLKDYDGIRYVEQFGLWNWKSNLVYLQFLLVMRWLHPFIYALNKHGYWVSNRDIVMLGDFGIDYRSGTFWEALDASRSIDGGLDY